MRAGLGGGFERRMRDLGGGYLGIGMGVEGEETDVDVGSCGGGGGGAEGREEKRFSPGSDGKVAIVTDLQYSTRFLERDREEGR